MTTVAELALRDPKKWARATSSPFLDGVRDGTLDAATFDRWLEQDRLFVIALVRAWARVLVDAPPDDFGLLSSGIAAFVDEVAWFEDVARDRGLDLGAVALPAARAYNDWLLDVADEPYPVAIAAMWAVEAAYLEAWSGAKPGAPLYRPFVGHWASAEFAAFVDTVAGAADRALGAARPGDVERAAVAVATTLGHEARFWALTTGR